MLDRSPAAEGGLPYGEAFPGGPVALISPFLEIGLRQRRLDLAPGCFETGARLIEVRGRAAAILTWPHARIEAAAPFPLVNVSPGSRPVRAIDTTQTSL